LILRCISSCSEDLHEEICNAVAIYVYFQGFSGIDRSIVISSSTGTRRSFYQTANKTIGSTVVFQSYPIWDFLRQVGIRVVAARHHGSDAIDLSLSNLEGLFCSAILGAGGSRNK
jgi:hypothetical protein